jgi:hypothetical protein
MKAISMTFVKLEIYREIYFPMADGRKRKGEDRKENSLELLKH